LIRTGSPRSNNGLVNWQRLAALPAALLVCAAASGAQYLVYAGAADGIRGYRFDARSARLKRLGTMAEVPSPSFLVVHPDHRFLYALNGAGNGVSAFLIAPKSGKLSLVNQADSKGTNPCHLMLDGSGRWLAVANCGSGSVSLFPLRRDGGIADPQSVTLPPGGSATGAPRPQGLAFSPDNHFLLVADQGLDRIVVYRFNADTGALTPADPPFAQAAPGSGPRRLAFHPNGRLVYVVNETQPGVTAWRFDPAKGSLDDFQTVSLLQSAAGRPGAGVEIALNAAGTLVYASDGASDTIGLLVVDPVRFSLSVLEFTPLVGRRPSGFALDPTGAFLLVANHDSNYLTIYTVHPHSGQLRPAGRAVAAESPTCVVVVPVP